MKQIEHKLRAKLETDGLDEAKPNNQAKTYGYDIECYPNFFSVVFVNVHDRDEAHIFYIYGNRNDWELIREFISQRPLRLAGFNNKFYDNILLNRFYINNPDKPITAENLYFISKTIIETNFREYPAWMKTLQWHRMGDYQSEDIMKVVTVNMNRPSLKRCEIIMLSPKVQDLPIEPDSYITDDQVDLLLKYCKFDVDQTINVRDIIIDAIELREQMGKKYKIDLLSSTDTEISKHIIGQAYGRPPKKRGTPREKIKGVDLLPMYYMAITKELKTLIKDVAKATLYQSKKHKWNTRVKIGNTSYDFGSGGLHSLDKKNPGVFYSTDEYTIIDADVASYYPSLILNERICPAHVDINKMLAIYALIVTDRLEGKAIGDLVHGVGLKIPINGFYGLMNYRNWWLYDPLAAFKVTFGGELYQLDLIEKLELAGIEVISGNTDGFVSKVATGMMPTYVSVCNQWQERTKLTLEYNRYSKYGRKDVNNYFAIAHEIKEWINEGESWTEKEEKFKVKGCFEPHLELNKLSFVKGYDVPVVALALQAYFKNDIKPETFIMNHDNIYHFCAAPRMDKTFTFILRSLVDGSHLDVKQQKNSRFFVSHSGDETGIPLKYRLDNGKFSAMPGYKSKVVRMFNDWFPGPYDLDYAYYIEKAWNVIDIVEGRKKGDEYEQMGLLFDVETLEVKELTPENDYLIGVGI